MADHEYIMSEYDHCIFYIKICDSSIMYLILYVGHILKTAKTILDIWSLKSQLSDEFKMDLGGA